MCSEIENRQKAVGIIVESLKLYMSLCTVLIAATIAFYSNHIVNNYIIIPIVSLALGAILSVATVNSFVRQVYKGEIDIDKKSVKNINIFALTFMLIGIFSAMFLFFTCDVNKSKSNDSTNGITINGETIIIGPDVSTKVLIEQNTRGQILKIKINN